MRKLVGVLVAGAFLVGYAGAAAAEGDDTGPNFTFGAATSYAYDINDPSGDADTSMNSLAYPNLESRDESFNIDLIQLGVNGSRGKASYAAKIDFGDLAAAAGDSEDGDVALQTASLTYDFGGAAVTAGRIDTPFGYEVLEPWGNANISRSWSWISQPINHDGLFVSGSADVIDVMIGAVNGYTVNESGNDGRNDFDDDSGVVGAIGAGLSDAVNLYFAAIYTPDEDEIDRQAYNAIFSGNVDMNGSGLRYAIEGNYRNDEKDKGTPQGDNDQWSIVLYGGTDLGPTSLDVRWEWVDSEADPDTGGSFLIGDDNFGSDFEADGWSLTLTAGWYLTDGLQFRLEYRHDQVDDDEVGELFADDDDTSDHMDIVMAQVVWYPEL